MKSLIHSIFLFATVAVFSLGCERRNFEETQELHKTHDAHGDHGDSHKDAKHDDAGKKADSHKTEEKKKAHH